MRENVVKKKQARKPRPRYLRLAALTPTGSHPMAELTRAFSKALEVCRTARMHREVMAQVRAAETEDETLDIRRINV